MFLYAVCLLYFFATSDSVSAVSLGRDLTHLPPPPFSYSPLLQKNLEINSEMESVQDTG
jgi:hypothetical protein